MKRGFILGVLLSASFVVFFFMIQENLVNSTKSIYVLLYSAILSLILSMVFAVISAYLYPPSPVATIGERLQQQLKIYKREYSWAIASLVLLFLAILLFLASMTIFAFYFG